MLKEKPESYSVELTNYIIRDILIHTIDREILFKVMKEDLEPIIGNKVLDQCFERINSLEIQSDRKKERYWINKSKYLNEEVFNDD